MNVDAKGKAPGERTTRPMGQMHNPARRVEQFTPGHLFGADLEEPGSPR